MYKKYFFNICVVVSIFLNLPLISMKKGGFEKDTWQALPGELQSKIITYLPTKKERLSAKLISKNTFLWAQSASLEDTQDALKTFFLYPHLTDVKLLEQEKNDFYGALKRTWEPSTETKDIVSNLLSDVNTRRFFYGHILEDLLTPYFYSNVCLSLFSLDYENYEVKLSQEAVFSIPIKTIKLRQQQEEYKNKNSIDTVFLIQINKNASNSAEFNSLMEKVGDTIKARFLDNKEIKNVRVILDTKDKNLSLVECMHRANSFNEFCFKTLTKNEKEKIKIFDVTPLFTTILKDDVWLKNEVETIIDFVQTTNNSFNNKIKIFFPASFGEIMFYNKLLPSPVFLRPDYCGQIGMPLAEELDYIYNELNRTELNQLYCKNNLTLNYGFQDYAAYGFIKSFIQCGKFSPFTRLQNSDFLFIDLLIQKLKNVEKNPYYYDKADLYKALDDYKKTYDFNIYQYRNDQGNTLLHCYGTDCDMVKFLHQKLGINIHARDKNYNNFAMSLLNNTLEKLHFEIQNFSSYSSRDLVGEIRTKNEQMICILEYFLLNSGTLMDYDGGTIFLHSILKEMSEITKKIEVNFYYQHRDLHNAITDFIYKIKSIILQYYPFLYNNIAF